MAMMVEHGMLEADRINHGAMMGDGMMGGTMMHDSPSSVLLEPGQTGEIVLKFTGPGDLQFALQRAGACSGGDDRHDHG